MLFQQGDVLLKTVSEIPSAAVRDTKKNGAYVLAEGEVTGHAHAIRDEVECFITPAGVRMVRAGAPFTVWHEEHKPITVPAGIWEIGIVQEYDHFAAMISRKLPGEAQFIAPAIRFTHPVRD